MQIAGYLKTSLIEWPGKISSVVFTPGCNFRCPFCHNPDLIDPKRIKKIPLLPEKDILQDLQDRKDWIDAVVITGGEPSLQKDLGEFSGKLGEMGFLRMIHTNGTSPEMIKSLLAGKLADYLCMDLKGDFESYGRYAGVAVEIEKIKESIKLIAGGGVEFEFRTTVVPGFHNLENLTELANQLEAFSKNYHWYLQQFRPLNCFDAKFMKLKPYSQEQMIAFQRKLQKIIPQTFLRGF